MRARTRRARRRRGEAEPERDWGGAHGVEGMAASLTGYLDGGERRRGVTQRRRADESGGGPVR